MESGILLSAIGLALALLAGAISALTAFRGERRRAFLSLVFLEAGLYFASELLASLRIAPALSLALGFGSAFYGLPALYFYARALLGLDPGKPLGHFLPALAALPLGTGVALSCAASGFRGGLGTILYILLVIAGQTSQLVFYGRASMALTAGAEGASPWPRRALLAGLTGYGLFLALSWASAGFMLADFFLDRPIPVPEGIDLSGVTVSVLLVWTVGLCALWGTGAAADRPANRADGTPKYGGRPLDPDDAASLIARARALLESETDLGDARVSPRRLASRLGAPYYLLSRAANENAGTTLAELVNEARIERAKRLLWEEPGASVLDVALESGFSAKSTFNEVFKRRVGLSPTEYRRSQPRQ